MQHHENRPRKIEKWVQQWFASQCIRIRILGKGIEKQVEKHLKVSSDKLVIIPEGSFVDWYPQTVDNQKDARAKLQLKEQEKVWLYFGNLRPYKGVEALIDYFSNAKPTGTRLIIAGNPYSKKYAESLHKRANGNPHISLEIRKIADEEISIYFQAADLVVLPFKEVLNSSTVNLAMSFAKPVVAAAKGLVPFRLQKQPELLFSQHQPLEKVLDMVSQLDKSTLEAIGAQNLEEVERYTWNDFASFLSSLMHG
jgi:glycosyltransferase involved in cell wall biosynthesis